MTDFTTDLLTAESTATVRLRGEATCTDTSALRRGLWGALRGGPRCVVVDLSELRFINSLAIGVLLEFRLELDRRRIDLRLVRPRPDIADILRRTRLMKVFDLETPNETHRPAPSPGAAGPKVRVQPPSAP